METGFEGLTKKERLGMERDQGKLQASLGGIREMGGVPDLLFVIDVNKETLAIAEAKKLGIPVVAIVDTNCSPDGIDYVIPGNDDAARAIALYTDLAARAALDGMSAQLGAAGVDMGAMEEAPEEKAVTEVSVTLKQLQKSPLTEAVQKSPLTLQKFPLTLQQLQKSPLILKWLQKPKITAGAVRCTLQSHLHIKEHDYGDYSCNGERTA